MNYFEKPGGKQFFSKKDLIFNTICAKISLSESKVRPLAASAVHERLIFKEDKEMDLVKALNSQYMKEELPEAQVGDTVRVHVRIKEGSRERIQVFEGTVIARKHGGIGETITVRRISYGVGCEKVFPLHSPNVAMIETVRKGKVRRAKLYYLRGRFGRATKIKENV